VSTETTNKYRIPFIALTSLFFMWGFMTVIVDAFVPRLKEIFELTQFRANLVQFAWFTAYGLISIPAGLLISKIDYKRGIIVGLAICGLGCALFIPAASTRMFIFFLLALFTLAGGITILQVAANPFVSVLGPERTASSRLNLAQTFNSLGTFIAPVFAVSFLLSDNIKTGDEISALGNAAKETYYAAEASAVQGPFLYIALFFLTMAAIFAFIKLPSILNLGSDSDANHSYGDFMKYKNLWMGMIGIFVYVGAEVAIGTNLINYFLSMNLDKIVPENSFMNSIASFISTVFNGKELAQVDAKGVVGLFVIFYWGGAMIGRFIGSFLTRIYNPGKVLAGFTIGAIILLILTMSTVGLMSMWTALAIGLFNSIMFPTIFTLAIDGLGDFKPKGAGLLCTAIVGGAVIPPLLGLASDSIGWKLAFIVPILCYLYIMYYGLSGHKHEPYSDLQSA